MSRQVKVEIDLDIDSGRYQINFKRVNDKNFELDWGIIKPILEKVIQGVDKQIDGSGDDSTDEFTKMIH